MLGVIGGTGLYNLEDLEIIEERNVTTPFGAPSAPIVIGQLGDKTKTQRVAFLPRHGLSHEMLPSEINFRANIFALKSIGVTAVIGVSAVGSLRHEVKPGDLALPSQYIDMTKGKRASTFFGQGMAAHVSTADPTCSNLTLEIALAAEELRIPLHRELTYACVEGPRLGTRAESKVLRQLGADLVGMTNVPEVFLAREAQLSYCTITIATDYDCWLEDPSQHAQVDRVMQLYAANVGRVKSLIRAVCSRDLTGIDDWPVRKSLQYALLTKRESLSAENRAILDVLER